MTPFPMLENPSRQGLSLTVVVVAYQSLDRVGDCLRSLESLSPGPEVIVVDNEPSPALEQMLATHFPQARYIKAPTNLGYAGGNNLGIHHARPEFVLVLNPDTVVHPDAISEMMRVARSRPKCFVTPKLLLADGRINACGNQMHYTGITTCIGLGQPASSIRGITRPPLLSGAAILGRRDSWREVGGFEESFFMYLDDADFSIRARSLGYDILCAADAAVIHHYDLGMTASKFYYLERNRIMMLLGNLDAATMRRLLPGLLFTQVLTSGYAVLKGPRYAAAHLRVYGYLLRHGSGILGRKGSSPRRERGRHFLSADAKSSLSYDQVVSSPRLRRVLNHLTASVYELLRPSAQAL